jgi:hypothetical protein
MVYKHTKIGGNKIVDWLANVVVDQDNEVVVSEINDDIREV